jgi:membrane protein implicated in regulation of membrane protease activity
MCVAVLPQEEHTCPSPFIVLAAAFTGLVSVVASAFTVFLGFTAFAFVVVLLLFIIQRFKHSFCAFVFDSFLLQYIFTNLQAVLSE